MEPRMIDYHKYDEDLLWKVRDFIGGEIVIFLMWLSKEGYIIDPRGDTCTNEKLNMGAYVRDKYFEYSKLKETPARTLPMKQGDEMGAAWGITKEGKDITVGSFDYTGKTRVCHIWRQELFTDDPVKFAKQHKLDEIIYHQKF